MTSYTAFENALLSFIWPNHLDTFGIHNPIGMKFLVRLQLGFKEMDERIISDNTSILDQFLLQGNENYYNHDTNKKILWSTIKFCIDSKRFDMPLL